MKNSFLNSALSVLVTILTPVVLILTMVRLLLFPWFLTVEYNMPGFPPDSYGFTQVERMGFARNALDYLTNEADISYLGNLRFPPGQSAPPESCREMEDCGRLFNQRELKHMLDVKKVVAQVLIVWRMAAVLLVLCGLTAWGNGRAPEYWLAVGRGGWLTAILAGGVVLLALLAFGFVFVAFHDMFFASGTWLFLYSDTLIRLFPERFWQDVFLYALGIPALAGVVIGILVPRNVKPGKP
jgi:integral membrane protein (TIGR01906 family)